MKLNRSLLTTFHESTLFPKEFLTGPRIYGQYSTLHFVLRLSPEIHRTLAATPAGIYKGGKITFEQIQAFSTLLHESIHWWQHIGSTAGLMLSLSHPVQSHCNYTNLKTFLREIGPKKSILKFSGTDKLGDRVSEAGTRATNIIVNNYKDVSFFQTIAVRPDLIRENQIGDDPHFECVGHSYVIMYSNTLLLLAGLFDRDHTFLPDPRAWEAPFEKLRNKKVEGFYWGSPIAIPPVGLRELFEGQARFIQLQYLHFASGGRFGWDDARVMGMLGPMYKAAFEQFLELTEASWPDSIDDPLVALFLALCDMTINAGEGFPLALVSPNTFVSDNDPGTRFTFLCRLIALKAPHVKGAITSYSRAEYIEVTEEVSKLLLTPSPVKIAQTVTAWSQTQPALVDLMEEDRVFRFSEVNMPARLLFARYINFNRDKAQRPEILCWPGAWLAGKRASTESEAIFNRNGALFFNKEADNGIFPAILPGKDPDIVQETFNNFYAWIVNYMLISQWISREGGFAYNYDWLSMAHQSAEVKEWAGRGFERVFGVHPNDFEIL